MEETKAKEKIKAFGTKLEKSLDGWLGAYIKNGEDEPVRVRALLLSAGKGLFTALSAYLFSRGGAVGGTTPFGLALLCATGERGLYALSGLLFSFLMGGKGVYALSSILCFGLRFLVGRLLAGRREPLYQEPLPLRMAIGSAGGFTVGLYGIVTGGFAKSRLWEALFLIAVIPVAVWLFYGAVSEKEISSGRRQAGRMALLYATILGLGSFSAFGFAPDKAAALFLTLALASEGGVGAGCLGGVVSGLACGAVYSPLFALCGLAAGAVKGKGTVSSLLAAVGAGGAFSVCAEGFMAFTSTLPSLLWGGALYLPAARFGLLKRLPFLGGETVLTEEGAVSAALSLRREEDNRKRLTALSEALSSLSGVFYALSNRLATPGTYELRELCEGCFKKYCASCRRNGICWGQEYDRTADILNKLAKAVASHGAADSAYIPDDFLTLCPHAPKALSEVNLSHARLLEQAARQNKTEVFALDYDALATLLSQASEENAAEFRQDEEMTRRARKAADAMGLVRNNLAVYGTRKKQLIAGGVALSRVKRTAEEMRQAFGEACGLPFTVPEFRIDDRYVTMTAVSAPVISCESARASLRKEDEAVNGDSAVIFENREGYFYALISDGMGSGSDAAVTSRITCIFLEKLLSAGNRKNTVLTMLNHFIRHKNLECFATVDLLEVDLLTGEASFVKSGAAASYILREGKLFKLESSSLPIGITREITAEEIRFSLLPGDLVVMISDGISQSFEDGVWLLELLSDKIDPIAPLSLIARRILDEAKAKNHRSDDMTVEIVRVGEGGTAAGKSS